MIALLLVAQWIGAVMIACYLSPNTWAGRSRVVHNHVYAALFLGGAITSFPALLAYFRPGEQSTRYILACAQVLWSGLLIHLTGGRIETHFHIFGSLAFLAFYRDLKVLIPATAIVAADHFVRGLCWPESIYGVANPEWWRFLEHAGWVAFIDVFLIHNCQTSRSDLKRLCWRQAEIEGSASAIQLASENLERMIQDRTSQLSRTVVALEDAKSSIEEKQKRAFQFLEGIPLCIYVVDRSDALVYANDAARVHLGDLTESSHRQLFRATNPGSEINQLWSNAFDGKSSAVLDVQAEGRHGQFPVFLKVVPIAGSSGDVDLVLTTFEDVSDRKRLEAERLHSQKLESVGQLAAGIAHEINTPMQYIGDNAHFLEAALQKIMALVEHYDELLHEDGKRALAVSKAKELKYDFLRRKAPRAARSTIEGVEAVSKLVRAMKEFSHPGTDEKSLVDINRAIETTLTVSKNEWKYAADIETDFDAALPMVPCLPGELNQVVLNLIVNASHAISDKNKDQLTKGTIAIRTRLAPPFVEIAVRDDGGGIPEAIRRKIFDPFFTTKEVGRGTGQGLAIARSIVVDKHGGSIDLESVVGTGTTFTIRLPLEPDTGLRGAA